MERNQNKTKANGLVKLMLIPITAGVIGCGNCVINDKYQFKGNIGGEEINFSNSMYDNSLKIKRTDGTRVKYIDYYNSAENNDTLKIDKIIIKREGKKKLKFYRYLPSWKEVGEEGQKQFDDYLAQIKAIKYNDALEAIKGK
jgi:hypothetical protein